MTTLPAHLLITKAKAKIIINYPFFAALLLPMSIYPNESVESMETDGDSIAYNPQWTESLGLDGVIFVLAHEALHCVFDHMGRREGRDAEKWNIAADYIINGLLVSDGIGKMPDCGLLDADLVRRGGNTDVGVYNILPENHGKKALDKVNDSGTENGKTKPDNATIAKKKSEMKVRVNQAKNAAKIAGKLSGGMARLIDEILKERVNWREALRHFFTEKIKTDLTYAKPKRRFLGEDFVLPSLTGEGLGKIVLAIDCSGSITERILAQYSAEINAIKEDTSPREIEVLYFDTSILKTESFSREDSVVFKPLGGGGTDFAPIFKHLKDSQDVSCVVVLTDLYCNSFGDAPDCPVLWVSTEAGSAPFGSVLLMERE